jgi:hypothetical protein
MIENTTNPAARRAIETAHQERARVIKSAWDWLFASHSFR